MPRQPRLDAPGALHHVMGRGIERTNIFRTDVGREDFVDRLAELCLDGSLVVYAWSLLSNLFHLLVRTGRLPISSIFLRAPATTRRDFVSGLHRPGPTVSPVASLLNKPPVTSDYLPSLIKDPIKLCQHSQQCLNTSGSSGPATS